MCIHQVQLKSYQRSFVNFKLQTILNWFICPVHRILQRYGNVCLHFIHEAYSFWPHASCQPLLYIVDVKFNIAESFNCFLRRRLSQCYPLYIQRRKIKVNEIGKRARTRNTENLRRKPEQGLVRRNKKHLSHAIFWMNILSWDGSGHPDRYNYLFFK